MRKWCICPHGREALRDCGAMRAYCGINVSAVPCAAFAFVRYSAIQAMLEDADLFAAMRLGWLTGF